VPKIMPASRRSLFSITFSLRHFWASLCMDCIILSVSIFSCWGSFSRVFLLAFPFL